MRDNLAGAVWRLAIFVVVCLFGFFVMMLVFGQSRIQSEKLYRAEFTDVSGLAQDDFVRIAGVEVGKVKKISIESNSVVSVEFSADDTVVLTEGTRAAVRWGDVFGGRYLSLEEGAGATETARSRADDSHPTDTARPGLGLADRRFSAPVSGAGSRPGQRLDRTIDRCTSGPGYDGELVSLPDSGSDKHTG